MLEEKKLLLQSVVILVVGIVFVVTVQVLYAPRSAALMDAARVLLNSTHGTSPPPSFVPSEFGVDATSLVISGALSLGGSILIFLGEALIVILVAARVLNRTSKLLGLKPAS